MAYGTLNFLNIVFYRQDVPTAQANRLKDYLGDLEIPAGFSESSSLICAIGEICGEVISIS